MWSSLWVVSALSKRRLAPVSSWQYSRARERLFEYRLPRWFTIDNVEGERERERDSTQHRRRRTGSRNERKSHLLMPIITEYRLSNLLRRLLREKKRRSLSVLRRQCFVLPASGLDFVFDCEAPSLILSHFAVFRLLSPSLHCLWGAKKKKLAECVFVVSPPSRTETH